MTPLMPVVTEISPVFGLTLVGIMEWAAIAAVVGSGLIALVIHRRNKELLKQQKEASSKQLEQQRETNSAKLALTFLEYWKDQKYEELIDFIERLHRSEEKKGDQKIPPVLNIFEDIAILWNGKLMTKIHVEQFFGNTLLAIRESEIMQEAITARSKNREKYVYVNLRKMLSESEKWDL